jgi:uncharacterized protein YdaT
MTKDKDYHVVPNSDGGWDVKRENSDRASNHFENKQPAMERARDLATKSGGERVEHKRDGTISNPNSYGNDPNPPKDKVR